MTRSSNGSRLKSLKYSRTCCIFNVFRFARIRDPNNLPLYTRNPDELKALNDIVQVIAI